MARPVDRSRPKPRPWSPVTVVLTLTAGMVVLVGLFHLITRIVTA
ncbi:hypothetical protein [Microvirga pudoricolor]|nr:hypothetical protein [Microvirga pudoricolor]